MLRLRNDLKRLLITSHFTPPAHHSHRIPPKVILPHCRMTQLIGILPFHTHSHTTQEHIQKLQQYIYIYLFDFAMRQRLNGVGACPPHRAQPLNVKGVAIMIVMIVIISSVSIEGSVGEHHHQQLVIVRWPIAQAHICGRRGGR